MKRYNGEAPDWFKLQQYDFFNSLSSKDICYEIEIRRLAFNYLESEKIEKAKNLLIVLRERCSFIKTMELEGIFRNHSSDRFGDLMSYDFFKNNVFINFIYNLKNLPSKFINNICSKFPNLPVNTLLIDSLFPKYFIPNKAAEILKECLDKYYSNTNKSSISLEERVETMCTKINSNYSILEHYCPVNKKEFE